MLAEMGDTTFQLGSVHTTSHRALVTGTLYGQLLNASMNETLPGCVDCALQPYCGADPVFTIKLKVTSTVTGRRVVSAIATWK
jgi:hypothetical protein